MLGGKDRPEVLTKWIALSRTEVVPEVQLQLALSLGEARDAAADVALAKLCQRAPEHLFLRDAVLTGLGGRELELIEQLLPETEDKTLDGLLGSLAGCVLASRNADRVERLLTMVATLPQSSLVRKAALLNGMAGTPVVTARRPMKLAAEPAAVGKLQQVSSSSFKTSLSKALLLLVWPGKPGYVEAAVEPLTAAQQQQFDIGKQLYTGTCAACHQVHGLGFEGQAPPLADSEWVTGSVDRLARIAINGVRGPITVNNVRYGLDMPAWGVLGDEQLAAIFTYIRREWGHTAAPVETEAVTKVRAAVSAARTPGPSLNCSSCLESELNGHCFMTQHCSRIRPLSCGGIAPASAGRGGSR